MLNLLKQKWWKYLGIILLVYVGAISLLTPLGPGIIEVAPFKAIAPGDVTLNVTAYNSHFQQAESSLQVWLRYEGRYLAPDNIQVLAEDQLSADFSLPEYFNAEIDISEEKTSPRMDVVINNDVDGTFILRTAFLAEGMNVSFCKGGCPDFQLDITTDEATSFNFPYREVLHETIRNLFFHVPMWFSMVLILLFSFVMSIRYLGSGKPIFDVMAASAVAVGIVYGIMGLTTGMTWANFTWGSPWPNDPKLNGAAIGVMIYLAYMVLRGSISDEIRRAKVSAVYSIFAFVIYLSFIFVIPRMMDSLHPGADDNPAFSQYDLDNTMRLVFYPGVIGWAIIGFWLVSLRVRYKLLEQKVTSTND